jgi:hypothetical protein
VSETEIFKAIIAQHVGRSALRLISIGGFTSAVGVRTCYFVAARLPAGWLTGWFPDYVAGFFPLPTLDPEGDGTLSLPDGPDSPQYTGIDIESTRFVFPADADEASWPENGPITFPTMRGPTDQAWADAKHNRRRELVKSRIDGGLLRGA